MNKFFVLMTFIFISCLTLITGCYNNNSTKSANAINPIKSSDIKSINNVQLIKFSDIRSAKLGGRPTINYVFNLNNSEQKKILKDIIGELNSGKIQGHGDTAYLTKGGGPIYLSLELNNGLVIQIESAKDSKVITKPGLLEVSYIDIPNEVTISDDKEMPIRMLSPELKNFIDGGYKNTFK